MTIFLAFKYPYLLYRQINDTSGGGIVGIALYVYSFALVQKVQGQIYSFFYRKK